MNLFRHRSKFVARIQDQRSNTVYRILIRRSLELENIYLFRFHKSFVRIDLMHAVHARNPCSTISVFLRGFIYIHRDIHRVSFYFQFIFFFRFKLVA